MGRAPERRAVLIGVLLVAAGLASARLGYAAFEQRQAMLALLTGWLVTGCGLLAWLQVPASRTGPLLVIAGATWFIGGFRGAEVGAISAVAGALKVLFAAVATHAILTFPTGRIADRRSIAVVVAAYGAALIAPPFGQLLIAATLLLGLAFASMNSAGGGTRRRRPAIVVGSMFAIALVADQVLPVVVPVGARFDFRLVIQIAFMVVGVGLSVAVVRESSRRARVTDLVVELDPSRGGLARELAVAIGDPTLEVGYWLPEQHRYVDPAGRTTVVPRGDDGRGTTSIERDGSPVAILIHDPMATADPAIRAATARAAELGTVNARLQAEARAQATAVDASRRRILQAADDERRELVVRLRTDVEPTLEALALAIAAAAEQTHDPEANLAHALEQLDQTHRDLAGITEGLHPRILDERGLRGALEWLVARSPIPVVLTWDGDEPADPEVRTALYFACSEGLTNVVKHAKATRVQVGLTRDASQVSLEIHDDGVGGASIGAGTGLKGLRDRLETLGGSLTVRSPVGGTTRLTARLPVGPSA